MKDLTCASIRFAKDLSQWERKPYLGLVAQVNREWIPEAFFMSFGKALHQSKL
ncbi:MAG: hypothetical protein J7K02_07760 [Deltaproteobacteria bacterium]|nr:hypothetical protein [Deltaproteobacteria bacterium]